VDIFTDDATLWIMLSIALILVVYVYAGYPFLLGLFRLLFGQRFHQTADAQPRVTLIIPAHNEAKVIREKLENSLRICYPFDQLEIIVASDGSEDGTNDIVLEYQSRGVKLLPFFPRGGKISVLNRAIPAASGEIVVLCDANVMFLPDALTRLVRHFADPRIGAVTGDVRIRSEDATFGESEGLYYKYERFIQLRESELGSTVTVDGGMYAIRKELFRPLPGDTILDDLIIGMNVALAGTRVLYDPSAVATENATENIRQEFRRKIRIVAGAFRELLRGHGVPSPLQPQLFWSYVSHKVLRWFVPWLLLVILSANVMLTCRATPSTPAIILLLAQLTFYGCALIGCLRPNARWPAVVGVPFYFCMVNTAAWLGSLRGITGVERVTWKKAER
jgi:cellulose synthase/poly-beta-1,6-N-acetylglucosamine synthase-like glycosyltransferase